MLSPPVPGAGSPVSRASMISIVTTDAVTPVASDRTDPSRSSIHLTQSVGSQPGNVISSPVSS